MGKFKVYQNNNAVYIENLDAGTTNYISIPNFSFEIQDSTKTVQLVDSSLEEKVESMYGGDIQDSDGVAIDLDGTPKVLAEYLSSFAPASGGGTGGDVNVTNESLNVVSGPTSKTQLVDEDGLQLPVSKDLASLNSKGLILMGEDKDGILRRLRTETDGRLISSASVVNPPNTTSIGDTQKSTVASTDDSDTLIPNGETLIIQNLSAGAEGDVDGSAVELWQYADVTKLNGILLGVLYVNGSNGSLAINRGFIGDGSSIITMRRKRLAGGQKEIFGVWQGYF
jgi:hypothetical protein